MFTSAEPLDQTLDRRQRMAALYPALHYSTPTDIAQIDAGRTQVLPTNFTQDMVRYGNQVSDELDDPASVQGAPSWQQRATDNTPTGPIGPYGPVIPAPVPTTQYDEGGNPITPSVYDPTSVGGGGRPIISAAQRLVQGEQQNQQTNINALENTPLGPFESLSDATKQALAPVSSTIDHIVGAGTSGRLDNVPVIGGLLHTADILPQIATGAPELGAARGVGTALGSVAAPAGANAVLPDDFKREHPTATTLLDTAAAIGGGVAGAGLGGLRQGGVELEDAHPDYSRAGIQQSVPGLPEPRTGLHVDDAQPGQWVWDGKKAIEVTDAGFWSSENSGTNITLADGSTRSSASLRPATTAEKNAAEESAMRARMGLPEPAVAPEGVAPEATASAEAPPRAPEPALIHLDDATPGLTLTEKARNAIAQFKIDHGIGKNNGLPFDEHVTPIMQQIPETERVLRNQSNALVYQAREAERVLGADREGIVTLTDGSKADVSDIAQDLSRYRPLLTDAQAGAIQDLSDAMGGYRDLAQQLGRPIGKAEGDAYIPRGNPTQDGLDDIQPLASGGRGFKGAKAGVERGRVYDTVAEGRANGETYPSLPERIQNSTQALGRAFAYQHASNQLQSLVDEAGNTAFQTPKEIVATEHPDLTKAWGQVQDDLASVRGKLATAEGRAGLNAGKADELDTALAEMQRAQPEGGARPMGRLPTALRNIQTEAMANSEPAGLGAEGVPGDVAQSVRDYGIGQMNAADRLGELIPDDAERIRFLDTAINRTARRLDTLSQRGGKYATDAEALKGQLEDIQGRYDDLAPQYRAAINGASRGRSSVPGMVGLQGQYAEPETANQVNRVLNKQGGTGLANVLQNIQKPFMPVRMLFDEAYLGRMYTGRNLAQEPAAASQALAASAHQIFDPGVVGRIFDNVDAQAGDLATKFPGQSGFSLREMIADGLDVPPVHDGDLPFIGETANDILNRTKSGLSVYQATLGPQMAQNRLRDLAEAGTDLTPDVRAEVMKITNQAIGRATGDGIPGVKQFAMFPNWFTSELQFLGNAAARGGISGDVAREAILRNIALGVTATIAGNTAQGKSTPIVGGVPYLHIPGSDDTIALTGTDYRLASQIGRAALNIPSADLNVGQKGTKPGLSNVQDYGEGAAITNATEHQTGAAMIAGVLGAVHGDPSTLLRSKGVLPIGIGFDLATGRDLSGHPVNWNDPHYWERAIQPMNTTGFADHGVLATTLGDAGLQVREPTATEQLNQKVNEKYPDRPFGVEPYMLAQAKADNPDLADAKASTATKQATAAKQVMDNSNARLENFDKAFQTDGNAQAWKDAYSKEMAYRSGALDQVYKGSTPLVPDPGKPWQVYSKAVQDAVDPKTGQPDWTKVDAVYNAMTPEQQGAVDRNLGLTDTPLRKEYKTALQALKTTGLRASQDEAWSKIAAATGVTAKTEQAYRAETEQAIGERLASAGIQGDAARSLVSTIYGKTPAAQVWSKVNQAIVLQWVGAHTKEAHEADKFGLISIPRAISLALAGAQ